MLRRAFEEAGVAHHYDEHDGGHFKLNSRFDSSLPFLARALSDRESRGLRPDRSPALELVSASAYLQQMEEAGILVDRSQRRERVREQVEALAAEVGGTVPEDADLLDEYWNSQ